MCQMGEIIGHLLPCDNIDESPSSSFGGIYKGVFVIGNHYQQKQPPVHPLSTFVLLDSRLTTCHILQTVLQ